MPAEHSVDLRTIFEIVVPVEWHTHRVRTFAAMMENACTSICGNAEEVREEVMANTNESMVGFCFESLTKPICWWTTLSCLKWAHFRYRRYSFDHYVAERLQLNQISMPSCVDIDASRIAEIDIVRERQSTRYLHSLAFARHRQVAIYFWHASISCATASDAENRKQKSISIRLLFICWQIKILTQFFTACYIPWRRANVFIANGNKMTQFIWFAMG